MTEPTMRPARWLPDPWAARGGLPLDGVLERHRFPPLLTAFAVLVVAFLLFQVFIGPLVIVLLLMGQGVSMATLAGQFDEIMVEHVRALLLANTAGEVLGLAVPALLVARLHTGRWPAFLRLRRADGALLGWSLLGLVALLPFVWWIGAFNEQLPLPEWLRAFEETQLELIERVLASDQGLAFNLLMLAVTPAICEELLFRGYAQRQFERAAGAAGGILLSGLLFGLYHLRISQVLPLAVLGVYLAYLVWRTGSLWPAVLVHFANNAFAVVVAHIGQTRAELDTAALETMHMPWYIVVAALLAFGGIVYAMQWRAPAELLRRHPAPHPPRIHPSESTEARR